MRNKNPDLFNLYSLKGKSVLVTGASSGIGRSVAIECSKMGANVCLVGRDKQRLTGTFNELSRGKHKILLADLSSEKEISDLISHLEPLDGVVNCAGIIKRIPLKLISEGIYSELLRINLMAPALLTKSLYKSKLLNEEASIVMISSVGTDIASLGNIMYMSSKGGLNSLMKGLALELAAKKIRVNSIEPAMIKTNLTTLLSDDQLADDIKNYPLGRYGKPEEVAYTVIFLLSDATKWMTGSIIRMDGGLSLK